MLHTRKDGVMFPVSLAGTVAINLPAVAATTTVYSTAVTFYGVLPGDIVNGLLMTNDPRTARILNSAIASNIDQVTLYFMNIGAAANAADYTVSLNVSRP